MRNLTKLTEEEIEFIIKCIQTFDILKNDNGEYSDIIEKVMDKVNVIDMKDKKKVVFINYVSVRLTESHTFIIDESYEIDEPIIEVEDEVVGMIELDEMNIIY